MATTTKKTYAANVDEYIAGFPTDVQGMLKEMRTTVKKAAPTATEAIKYGIPTYTITTNIISFAAFKKHIGLYPVPRNEAGFEKELSNYDGPKSTAQFPLDKPLPLSLVSKIVKHQVKRDAEKSKAKK